MLHEGYGWQNIAASKTFTLTLGGRYLFTANGTFSGGSVKIQVLSQDGSTYLDIFDAYDASAAEQNEPSNTLTAAGALVLDLAPGAYQLTITTATAVYASIARCPLC